MLTLLIVTGSLSVVTVFLNRFRSVEMLLLAPYAVGAVLLSLFGVVPLFDVSIGGLLLPACILFEWLLLTSIGFLYEKYFNDKTVSCCENKNNALKTAVTSFAIIIVGLLLLYIIKEFSSVIASPSIADYFISKRAAAHQGEGVDISSPLSYRAINFSMALLIIIYSHTSSNKIVVSKTDKYKFIFFIIIACIASLLEGNRSTLIVSIVAIVSSIFVEARASIKKILIFSFAFMVFFVVSMQIFRLNGDFSFNGLILALRWFGVYSFGSIASFPNFIDQDISTYWYAFDAVAKKFGDTFAYSIGARDFFIMDYVDIGDLHTNVYGSYAVLYDYLGLGLFLFIFYKSILFYVFKLLSRKSVFVYACYVALLGSYPLSIYHEFAVTSLYYCLNIGICSLVIYLIFVFIKFFRGFRKMDKSRLPTACAE